MAKIDLNRLIAWVALIVLVLISAVYGYRLEIGLGGFKFEGSLQTKKMSHNS